ncbi:hypothetical protein JW758_05130 [Candidatus Peregrinibacteria bacterium]|nr:hypothetical protein [Candidatus Peregrinibacteria bacterium]
MQLTLTTFIAGRKTVADWNSIKSALADFNNTNLWTTVYNDFFITRLNDRYLNPIKSIKQDGGYTGEGFSIMTIICSLIEFLETTYQGINYRFRRKGDPPLGQYEYGASNQIFIDFLTKHNPFNTQFNIHNANDFYKNIRCGLLHEARTNSNWTIWGNSGNGTLIKRTANETIIYRDDFYDALLKFINVHYKSDLLSSNDRKEAFIRKFDNLCEV